MTLGLLAGEYWWEMVEGRVRGWPLDAWTVGRPAGVGLVFGAVTGSGWSPPRSFLLSNLKGWSVVQFRTEPSTTFSFSLSSVEYPLLGSKGGERRLPAWLVKAPAPTSFSQRKFGTFDFCRASAGLCVLACE